LGSGGSPTWSPDSRLLAYSHGGVYASSADGWRPKRVAGGWSPVWSPDGRELAFANDDGVWAVNPHAGRQRLIVRIPEPDELAWSSG